MSRKGFELNLVNFEPKENFYREISRWIDRMQANIPTDAIVKTKIQRNEEGFVCSCKINSTAQSFDAETRGSDEVEALISCFNQIKDDVDNWKKERFKESS